MIAWFKYIVVTASLLMGSFCFAQDQKLDSLLTILEHSKEDTSKVNTLNDLFLEYEFTDDVKAEEVLNKALTLSQKNDYKKGLALTYKHLGYFSEDKGDFVKALKYYFAMLKVSELISGPGGKLGDKTSIANAYNNIGSVYFVQGDFPEALKNYTRCLNIMESIGDQKGVATAYGNIGTVYYSQGNHTEALKNYLTCLKIKEKTSDKKGIAGLYNNIGKVHASEGNYPEAFKNYLASIKIKESIGDMRGIGNSYDNIGGVYSTQAENEPDPVLRKTQLEQALKNHNIALITREKIGDKKGIAASLESIGIAYYSQAKMEADKALSSTKLSQALENYLAALKINEEIGNKAAMASTNCNIGNAYVKQGKYAEAKKYLNRAKELSQEMSYKEYLRDTYRGLMDLDSSLGNYKGAYENHKFYILYRDSLDNEETRKKIVQSQMTFDFEKKEAVANAEHKKELENQEILSEEKSRKQRIVLFLVLGSLVLVLCFAAFILRSLRITRKQKHIIELQKNVVEQQKREVELQKSLVEEHQKEIIDSIMYARRIQQSLLPTEKYIDKSLARLKNKL